MARHLTADDVRGWTYDDSRGDIPPMLPAMQPVPTAAMLSLIVAPIPTATEVREREATNRAARRRRARRGW